MFRKLSFLAASLAAFGALAACATVPADPVARAAYDEANDPLEPLNRAVFAFNMEVDRYVLEPVAKPFEIDETKKPFIIQMKIGSRKPV
mgnify:CR=1 FL=1